MRVVLPLALGLALTACSGSSKPGVTNTNGGNVAPGIASVALSPEPAYESTLLNCTATGVTDDDGDTVTLKYVWRVSGTELSIDTATLDGANFDKGDKVVCTVTPNDGATDGVPVVSNEVEILNSAPSANSVDVSPSPATPLDTLVATPNGWSDADPADGEDWRFDWFVNGGAAGNGSPQLAGEFVKGDQVYIVATPFDGTELGDPVQSDIVNILNTPPELTTATLGPANPIASDVLTCTPGTASDLDGDAVTFTYEWFVNGVASGSGTDILSAPAFGSGDDVYCVITPNDGEDDGTPVQSNTVTVGNSAPTMTSVTLAPDPATELDTLNCTPAGLVDPDGDAITVQFSWTVGGIGVAPTTSTLTGADFDKGDAVQCTVVATDGFSASPPTPSNVVIIDNTPPSVASAAVTPDPIFTNDTADVTEYGWNDIDGDVAQYTYQWFKGGIAVPGGTGVTLAGSNFVKHEFLSVEVTPFDGEDSGPSVLSLEIEVQNTPPTAPTVQVTPASPDSSSDLLCGFSAFSTDDDSDPITYAFSWTRNSASTIYTTNTVPSAATFLGDTWTCLVTPNDGEDDGTVGSHSVIVVDGTAPPAPVIDPIDRYRNINSVDLTGTAEANSTVEMTATCDGASGGVQLDTASPVGVFSFAWTMTPGETCDFQATATDAGNNTSPPSNVVTTTVCSSPDPWDNVVSTYGDSNLDPVDEWGLLLDNNATTVLLTGNLIDQDPDDWFVIHGDDNSATDITAGHDYYDLQITLTQGAPQYTFLVYKGSVSAGNLECSSPTGYDDYNDYWQDQGDAPDHAQASPTTRCGAAGTSLYNECEDMGNDYYIRVIRDPAVPQDCINYEITVTNNAP